ncbi:beta-eliminating lyase-related protein [Limobrevibacterium gyesilva]|uniref:Beta-eliminating lyase-related protein n=1 Tax=Limobrevibacterium gyesilva TaxID=2991712 RepID=A0AA41YKE3_9PROT|nr:beta-eliminating lyase-related protein [Limobrevibacterium gyesilva]MCW3475371.1 beta-eliminating lyase-related protein [Limobrevibacterium gyesilva]
MRRLRARPGNGASGGVIYETLGVPTLINAAGTVTRLSGGIMAPEVAEAMRQASLACVDMVQLQAAACRVIREATGAPAGIVTSGASAAVLLGAAACLAGLDPGRMNRLPEVPDGRRAFVVVRSQRNMYDRALVVAGARIVEVGIPDRYSGPGVRDAAAWEIEEAIGPDTAGIYYLAQAQSRPALRDVASIARRHGLPVLVDAAAQLPPACNLKRYLDEGADLVCFSGGKAIGGPQSSGILCGRADLVASALLQMLDLDVDPETWSPPAEFAALAQLRGLPHHGIGRSCKVGKEEIAGLLVALQRFAAADPAARRESWRAILQTIMDAAGGDDLRIASGPVPMLAWDVGPAARGLAARLLAGQPSIACNMGRADDGVLLFHPMALTPAHAHEIGLRLRTLR